MNLRILGALLELLHERLVGLDDPEKLIVGFKAAIFRAVRYRCRVLQARLRSRVKVVPRTL